MIPANWRAGQTLRLTPAILRTPVAVTFILLLVGLLSESLCRLHWVQARLPAPSLGTSNTIFELKWHQLEKLAGNGTIECVFVGNSAVEFGIYPEAFREGFRESTARDIRCYNFGVPAMTPYTASVITELLVTRYRPRFVVIGTSVLGYQSDLQWDQIATLPWLQYRAGHFNLQGWLTEHSRAFRYYLRLSRMAVPDFELTAEAYRLNYFAQHPFGGEGFFHPEVRPPGIVEAVDFNDIPDRNRESRLYLLVNNYRIRDVQLDGIRRLAGVQRAQKTQILVVEMPLHPSLRRIFPGGDDGFRKHRRALARQLTSEKLIYWPIESGPSIPPDGWWDRNHLNTKGATVFSYWLGTQMGKAKLPPRVSELKHDSIANGLPD